MVQQEERPSVEGLNVITMTETWNNQRRKEERRQDSHLHEEDNELVDLLEHHLNQLEERQGNPSQL